MGTCVFERDKKINVKATSSLLGVGTQVPWLPTPKSHTSAVQTSTFNVLHLPSRRIAIFPPACEGSIITKATLARPPAPIHPLPTPLRVLLGGLLESWLCFLCAARPRYHITAHMLMQQLPQPPPSQRRQAFFLPRHPTMEWNKLLFQFK